MNQYHISKRYHSQLITNIVSNYFKPIIIFDAASVLTKNALDTPLAPLSYYEKCFIE